MMILNIHQLSCMILNYSFTIINSSHSQGALIMRHMIQNWDNHNISTFISLVGPHVGVIKSESDRGGNGYFLGLKLRTGIFWDRTFSFYHQKSSCLSLPLVSKVVMMAMLIPTWNCCNSVISGKYFLGHLYVL